MNTIEFFLRLFLSRLVAKSTSSFVLLIFLVANGSVCQSQDSPPIQETVKVVQGLKDRRLFDLAESYANQQLNSESIRRIDKSTIVLEQIRCKVAEAISLTGDNRKNAWSQAEQFAENFAVDYPNHPQQMLVDVQDALGNLTHGSLIQQEIEAEIETAESKPIAVEQAIGQFKLATQKFKKIERQIEQQLPIVRSRTQGEGELSPQHLVNLKNNIRYRLAIINLAKAQLYDSDQRLNQIDALNQVLLRLNEVIMQSNSDVPLWWEAQISQAKCYRIMKEQQSVVVLFKNLPVAELSLDLECELLTERILSAIEFEQQDVWQALAKEYSGFEEPTAQLQLSALRLWMALAAKAAKTTATEEKQRWQSAATKLVSQIENRHGRYWGRRAEVLLVGAVESNPNDTTTSSDFELLVRQGDSAFRRNNVGDAIKAYSKAVDLATNVGNAGNAIATSARLAQCFEKLNKHVDAANRLFAVADQFVNEPAASSIHLRGCWNFGQAKDPESKKILADRLVKQISIWPDDENSNQAKVWLASHYQYNGEWKSAVETYLEIETNSSKMLAAIPQIQIAVRQWIDEVRHSGGNWIKESKAFVDQVSTKINIGSNQNKGQQSDAEKWLLICMIDVGLPAGVLNPVDVNDLLVAAIKTYDQQGSQNNQWRQQAIARQVIVLAKQQSADLQTAIQRLSNDSSVLRVCLNGINANLSVEQIASISDSIVTICKKALVDKNLDDREFWILEKAKAQIAGGRSENAVGALEDLANKNPKSLEIQLAFARALTKQQHDQERAIKQWRQLSKKVENGTESWFESKYNIIKLLKDRGQVDEANKLLKYLQATSPGWNESKWSKK